MRLYTTGELASYFRVSKSYILRLRKEGKLPHYKISCIVSFGELPGDSGFL